MIPPKNENLKAHRSDVQTKYSKSLGSIVKGFGGIDVATELSDDKAYRTSNGLTLSIIAREFFNIFYLWFEEIPVSHCR